MVNILAEDQEELSTQFAKSGGDKFGSLPFSTNQDGVPVLEGTLAHLECRIIETHEGGDHVIHIGEVQHAEVRGGRPLLFFQGKYRQPGRRLSAATRRSVMMRDVLVGSLMVLAASR